MASNRLAAIVARLHEAMANGEEWAEPYKPGGEFKVVVRERYVRRPPRARKPTTRPTLSRSSAHDNKTKEIPLTSGQVALVDADDYDALMACKWSATYNPKTNSYYAHSRYGLMHRIILDCPNDLEVDHINHDTLDNRRCNLRICTRSQNQGNYRKTATNTTSRYKGVSWHSRDRYWRAQIKYLGKRRTIGCFKSEEEAARAYDEAARQQWGEFALTNFPD